jgi:hypothetical protein
MFSFKTFATVATVAFGTLSALAAPIVDVHAATALKVRNTTQLPSIAQIIVTVTTEVAPFVEELSASRALVPSSMYSH